MPDEASPTDQQTGDVATEAALFFQMLNEIGIIAQLSRALLEARLPEGLIQSHFTVLNHLVRVGDGRQPIEMARAFQVPKTSITHTVSGLVARGLVELRPHPKDGRSKTVWLTDAGRGLRDETIAALAPDIARLSGKIPVGLVEDILPGLVTLRKTLDADRD